MSQIDQFEHECIGIVDCPSSYEIVFQNPSIREISIYRLLESASTWQAKAGDILIGGGSGEAPTFRISIPEAFLFFTDSNWDDCSTQEEIFQAFWNANQAYVLCDGYSKLGWTTNTPIEVWLTEHVLAFLSRSYPEKYRNYIKTDSIEMDGSICRLCLTDECD